MRGSCDGRTAGMFDETAMAEPWDSVGKDAMAGTHKAQAGASSGGEMLTLTVKLQWVRYKLEKTIEKPYSDFLAHTSKVCKGIPSVQWVSSCQG
jgi:hypothetical protein